MDRKRSKASLFTDNCELSTVNHAPCNSSRNELRTSSLYRENPGREISVRHRTDFFFDLGNIHHDDGVPRAAIQEAAVRTFTEALLAPDALEGVNLDAPERRVVFVRHPEHAVFHRTVLDASRRSRAAGAALRNNGKFLR